MDTITRRVKGKQQQFVVYTKEEADSQNLRYVPWREVEVGGWGLTDDGYVTECLRKQAYTDRDGKRKTCITFSFTRVWSQRSTKLKYEPSRFATDFYSAPGQTWQDAEARKTRTKNVVSVYVRQVLTGKMDYDELGRVYRPDQKIPAATVKRLFRQEKIRNMVKAEIKKEADERGMDEGYVLDIIKKAIGLAEKNDQPMAMLKGADMVADIIEMKPEVNKMITTSEFGITKELSDSILDAGRELKEGKVEIVDETIPTA